MKIVKIIEKSCGNLSEKLDFNLKLDMIKSGFLILDS